MSVNSFPDDGHERTIRISGTEKIQYLVKLLEKEYFSTKDPRVKRLLASLLSKLA